MRSEFKSFKDDLFVEFKDKIDKNIYEKFDTKNKIEQTLCEEFKSFKDDKFKFKAKIEKQFQEYEKSLEFFKAERISSREKA